MLSVRETLIPSARDITYNTYVTIEDQRYYNYP